ncbi:MAG: hypothetical protein QM579_07975 [Desulfovibrio sp.]|uniref:hypothetical protein n=1 Tax=Desulfovibrio sp. TaxID=885 RepID=UPI0039E55174
MSGFLCPKTRIAADEEGAAKQHENANVVVSKAMLKQPTHFPNNGATFFIIPFPLINYIVETILSIKQNLRQIFLLFQISEDYSAFY